jgi:hypothetical protein
MAPREGLGLAFFQQRPAEITALPTRLFQKKNVRNFHRFVEGFTHVVYREGCGANGDQRFHFHTGLSGGCYGGSYFNAILA